MKLSIVTAVSGRNEITRRFLDETIANCAEPHELSVYMNGSTGNEIEELSRWLNELEGWNTVWSNTKEPAGSSVALNKACEQASGDILAVLHNDVMVVDEGWDEQLIAFFEDTPNVGIVGFAGAKQIGAWDIYQRPYELTQLGRAHVFTSLVDWQPHGSHCVAPVKVAVLDGLSMCFTKDNWSRWGGFDEIYPHHCYDNDLSITSYFDGRDNYVIPVNCNHISGQTANFVRYGKDKTDGEVHQMTHRLMYDKWYGKLPIYVQD